MTERSSMSPQHLIVDRVAMLRQAALFAATPGRFLAGLASRLEEVSFTAGDMLITSGATEEWLLVLVQGEVQVSRPDGRVRMGPVNTIGELSVLDPGPRIADVMAVTDGWAFRLGKEDFDEALRLRPEIGAGIITALVRRLREMHERIE